MIQAKAAAPDIVSTVDTSAPVVSADVLPTHYAVMLEPDIGQRLFKGRVAITVEIAKETQNIILNGKQLAIDRALISHEDESHTGRDIIPLSAKPDENSQTIKFTAEKPIAPGQYYLEITYSGTINSGQPKGLFVVDPTQSREGSRAIIAKPDDWQMFSYLENNNARRVFPAWDQPGIKAAYDIALLLPAGKFALSNMPVTEQQVQANGKVLTRFATTPPMSSYLAFFGAGDFVRWSKVDNGINFGVVARPQDRKSYEYALESLAKIIKIQSDYLDQPYGLPKLDLVLAAQGNKKYIAMENWGAIQTAEEHAKQDNYIGGGDTRGAIFNVNAHEIAHQWFGNLVSPANWDELWLNEGMATWFAEKLLGDEFPQFDVGGQIYTVIDQIKKDDAALATTPLVYKSVITDDLNEARNTIVYAKGGSIIRMMESAVGKDKWQRIMRDYIAANKNKAVITQDLAAAIIRQGEAQTAAALVDFAHQPGFPFLQISGAKCVSGVTQLNLKQARYTQSSQSAGLNNTQFWHVPIRARNATGLSKTMMLNAPTGSISFPGCGAFTLNADAHGYYRVDYQSVLNTPAFANFSTLGSLDQLGILTDGFALVDDQKQSLIQVMDLMLKSNIAVSPQLISTATTRLKTLFDITRNDPDAHERVKALIRKTLGPVITPIGNRTKITDNFDYQQREAINLLDLADDPAVEKLAAAPPEGINRLFLNFRPEESLKVKIGFRNMKPDKWRGFFATLDSKSIAGVDDLLGTSKSPALMRQALVFALSGKLETYNRSSILRGASADNADLVLKFLLDNPRDFESFGTPIERNNFLIEISRKTQSPGLADRLAAYANTVSNRADHDKMIKAVVTMRARNRDDNALRKYILPWLAQKIKLSGKAASR